MSTVLTGEAIQAFRLLSMRSALKLEILGLRHSRGSVYATIKREFALRGSKASVLEQFTAKLMEIGIL